MSKAIYFSKFQVNKQVFFQSKLSYLLVNLRPFVPGHVMVVPYRVVPRLKDLTPLESQDLFETLQKIQKFIEYIYKADSLNIGIQDGALLGQSMPHVHIHIIPRYFTDGIGDAVYDAMETNEQDLKKEYNGDSSKFKVPDEERKNRSMEVMALELEWLKLEYENYLNSGN